MFELPRTRSPLPWYQQGRIKKWLSDLFALTSRKKTYTLQIGGSKGLAWVAPQLRRVYVTTKLPTTTEGHALLRFDPGNADARMELMLKGFIAHEAGHVRHSHQKPEGKVGRIWNCIEDERIERLMAAEFPELKVAFTFLGDIVNEQHRPKWSYTAMEGLLVWRFEHDRTTPRWQPRKADRDLWFDEILPRLEQGWQAPDSNEVERLAREIHALIKDHQENLNQQCPPPPPATEENEGQEDPQSDDPQPENTGDTDEAENAESDTMQDDQAGESETDEEPQSTEQPATVEKGDTDPTNTEESPDEPAPETEDGTESGQDSLPDSDEGNAAPSSDEEKESESPGKPNTPPEQPDSTESSSSDDENSTGDQDSTESPEQGRTEDHAEEATGNSDNNESTEEGEGKTDPASRPQRPDPDDPGPTSNATPEQQAAENADDDSEPEAWDEVDASGTDADELDGSAEEGGDDSASEEQPDDEGEVTSGQGGRNAGSERSLPVMPIPDRSTGEIIAKGVEGYARSLAPLLRPLDKPGQRRPHRSKGTYDVRRDLRGDEKVFQKKTEATRSRPLTVKLLIDISISMGGDPIEAARQTAVMLVRAAALCGSKVHIHLFNAEHHPLITEPMPYVEAISLVSQINVRGGTTLNPALKALTDEPIHPYESELIVVICDGELLPEDYSECRLIAEEGRKLGKRYLPVLIGDATSYAEEWKAVFGSALPCHEIRDIARTIQGSLTALRSRLG